MDPNTYFWHASILSVWTVVFIGVIVLAFIPEIGAKCGGELSRGRLKDIVSVYPACFYMAFFVYILYWFYHLYLYCNNYFIDENLVKIAAKQQVEEIKKKVQDDVEFAKIFKENNPPL